MQTVSWGALSLLGPRYRPVPRLKRSSGQGLTRGSLCDLRRSCQEVKSRADGLSSSSTTGCGGVFGSALRSVIHSGSGLERSVE